MSNGAATKADCEGLRAEIRLTELRMEAKIAEAKADTLKWVAYVAIGLQTAVILSVITAFAWALQP